MYRCFLTGNQDYPDIEIPISSISGSFNASNQRNLLIVCPNGRDYAAEIALRYSGEFTLYYQGLTIIENITDVSSDRGASNWSISIRGLKQISNPTPANYEAVGVSVISTNSNGKRRLTMQVNWSVLPGDTITYSGEEIIVGSLSYQVAANPPANYMTVTEA